MQVFSDRVQNAVIDDENFDAESAGYRGGGVVDAVDQIDAVDPKSARKEAVWGMKRDLIMDAAIKVMQRVGFMGVRLEDVAEEAGFSKAAIYHYFPDKESLIMNIVIREHRMIYERLAEVSDRGLPLADSIREITSMLHKTVFGMGAGGALGPPSMISPSMLSTIVVSMTKHEELFNETVMWRQKMNDILIKMIARAKADGSFAIPVDDKTVCLYINAFYQTIMMEHMHACHTNGTACDSAAILEATDKLLLLFKPWIRT